MFLKKTREKVFQVATVLLESFGGRILKGSDVELRFCLRDKNFILKGKEGLGVVLFTTAELLDRKDKSIGMPRFNFVSNGDMLAADKQQPMIETATFLHGYVRRLVSQTNPNR